MDEIDVLTNNSSKEFAIREEIENAFDKSIDKARERIFSSQERLDKSPNSEANISN